MNSNKEIRDRFKSKLNDFTFPIPEDGWERIEESLSAGRLAGTKSVRCIWQLVGTVAAVAVLILAGLLFIDNPAENYEPIVTEASQPIDLEQLSESLVSEDAFATDSPTKHLQKEKNKSQTSSKLQKTASSGSGILAKRSIVSFVDENIENIDKLRIKEEATVDNRIEEISNHKSSEKESEYETLIDETILITQDQDRLLAENTIRRDDSRLILSVGGKGGLTSFHQTVNSPMTLRSATVDSEPKLHSEPEKMIDRKSTRLNSSHVRISYAV